MTASRHNAAACRSRASRWVVAGALALLAACVTAEFEARSPIPPPLVVRIPVVVGMHIPAEFRDKVYVEKRPGVTYSIAIGTGQTDGFVRLMTAMFARAVPVASADAGARTDPEIRAVFEPVLEDFAFVTPADSGAAMYAVSLRYRINAYDPAGRLVESWSFTGYGSEASAGLPTQGKPALQKATALALRDAGAKIATEFREQAIVRGLLPPETEPEPAEATEPAPAETAEPDPAGIAEPGP